MIAMGAEVGLKPWETMDLTPREMQAFGKGVMRARLDDWRRSLFAAWHGANFARSKKLPDLQQLMRKMGGKTIRTQTVEEQVAMAVALNEAWGGKDLRGA